MAANDTPGLVENLIRGRAVQGNEQLGDGGRWWRLLGIRRLSTRLVDGETIALSVDRCGVCEAVRIRNETRNEGVWMRDRTTRGPRDLPSPNVEVRGSNGESVVILSTGDAACAGCALPRRGVLGRFSPIIPGCPTCCSGSASWLPMRFGTVAFRRRAKWWSRPRLTPTGSDSRSLTPGRCSSRPRGYLNPMRPLDAGCHHRRNRRPLGDYPVEGHGRLVRDRSITRIGELRAEEEPDLGLLAVCLSTDLLDDRVEDQSRD